MAAGTSFVINHGGRYVQACEYQPKKNKKNQNQGIFTPRTAKFGMHMTLGAFTPLHQLDADQSLPSVVILQKGTQKQSAAVNALGSKISDD
jgi:hypothetical protein